MRNVFIPAGMVLPLPTWNSSDFWIGNFARFTDKGLCASAERSDLLAKSSVGVTDSKIKRIFCVLVSFTVADFELNSGEFVW